MANSYMYKHTCADWLYTSEPVVDLMMDKSGSVEGVTLTTSEEYEDIPPPYSAQSSTDQLILTEMHANDEGSYIYNYTHS